MEETQHIEKKSIRVIAGANPDRKELAKVFIKWWTKRNLVTPEIASGDAIL
jgi:hypothetical protein